DAALMRSDGNPFHVEELAREGPDGRMSTTLREALQARLARLSPSARRVVFAVAAIGRVATQELIEAVIDDRPEELGGALGEALEHSILVQADDGTGFAFRHTLVQEAAADGLLPSERVVLHRKIVAALQAGGGASGEIARHAMLAHDAPTALAWSVKAADDAVAVVAFSEALAHVDRALELWPAVAAADRVAGRDLGSMLVLASDCAGALGLWARAADLGRAAVATLDPVERPEARASALLDLAHWAMMADQETDRAAAIHEAAALVPDVPPSALRARVLIELAHLLDHNGQAAGAQILAEEAAAISRRV